MFFTHLKIVKQSYCEHFKDAFTYSLLSFKASVYFFIHAIYPDIFETSGSNQISNIYNKIEKKYKYVDDIS